MTAHYLITLEEVHGGLLAEIQDGSGVVDDLLVPHSAQVAGIAQHIDPYGTTIFNGLQCSALMTEIASLNVGKLKQQQKELLQKIQALLRRASEEVHVRVSFLGD